MGEVRNLMSPTAVLAWGAKKWGDYTFKVSQLEKELHDKGFSEASQATPKQVETAIKVVDARNKELAKLRDVRPDGCDPMPCQSLRHKSDNSPVQPMKRNAVRKDEKGNFVVATHAKGGGVIEEGYFLVNTELKKMSFYCPACKAEAEKDAKANGARLRWYTFESGSKVLAAIERGEKAKIETERRNNDARAFEFGNLNVNSNGPGAGRMYKRTR
jgi:hypothetical protein